MVPSHSTPPAAKGAEGPAAVEVYTTSELARAAGVERADVEALLGAGEIETIGAAFVSGPEAVRVVRLLRADPDAAARARFRGLVTGSRPSALPLAASGTLHGLALGVLLLLAMRVVETTPGEALAEPVPSRLVFLATPGPGGGGGGGGLRQPAPPQRARLEGTRRLTSPVPPRRPIGETASKVVEAPPSPVPEPAPRPAEPPRVPERESLADVRAPVASIAADEADRAGTIETNGADSQGPGTGGGAGIGRGTGMGEGEGAGIGPGYGGGEGGGPFRAGSGITPPSLVREVRPSYTDEARRRGLAGDVLLEIVVRRDGRVGDIRLLRGLGAGLDERAIDAVRQWQFAPAHRRGMPVDVIVEVAVEFKLR